MPFTTPEQEAITRLETYNSNAYNASTNPYGLGGVGYKRNPATGFQGNWRNTTVDIALIADAIARIADEVDTATAGIGAAVTAAETAQGLAEDAQEASEDARDQTLIYRDQTAAIVAGAQFPVGTATGDGTDYSVDISPDFVVTDGAAIRINLNTANTISDPTVTVDGVEYDLYRDTDGVADFGIGELPNGMMLLCYYEATLGGLVALNVQKRVWYGNVNANGRELHNLAARGQIAWRENVTAVDGKFVGIVEEAMRWQVIRPQVSSGTLDFTIYKNGVEITFDDSGETDTITADNTSGTLYDVEEGGDGYIDFDIGDEITLDVANITGEPVWFVLGYRGRSNIV